MKIFIYFLMVTFFNINLVLSNNIKVQNASIEARDTVNKVRYITFDLSWDNSWRNDLAGGGQAEPLNWDAAWVFIKYARHGSSYYTATLSTDSSNHIAPLGCKIKPSADGKGVFIYRSQNGTGSVNFTGIKLQWKYGLDGASTNTNLGDSIIGFQVFALEMVYVPKGDNFVGDPAGSGGPSNCFYSYGNQTCYQIKNEDSILYGKTNGKLYSNWNTSIDNKVVPAAFPKGYNAFYVMKYEGTNQQYVDFLNSISPTQQDTRDNNIVADGSTRGGIYKELNEFKTSHPDRATVNLSFLDVLAYYDWAGMRVMTDFEYEKACRGLSSPISHEYAWGSTNIYYPNTNKRTIYGSPTGTYENGSEYMHDSLNCNLVFNSNFYKSDNTTSIGAGPLRVGIFAKANTNRFWSGATYNGVMDMTGNAYELSLSPHDYSFSGFSDYNGSHGDGLLAINGDCDIPTLTLSYPWYNVRGGNYSTDINSGKVAY